MRLRPLVSFRSWWVFPRIKSIADALDASDKKHHGRRIRLRMRFLPKCSQKKALLAELRPVLTIVGITRPDYFSMPAHFFSCQYALAFIFDLDLGKAAGVAKNAHCAHAGI